MCWDDRDIINGRPTGAVRASFGFASSLADAAAVAALVGLYFVEHKPPPPLPLPPHAAASGAEGAAGEGRAAGGAASQPAAAGAAASGPAAGAAVGAAGVGEEGRIEGLWVYPIKSCRGFSPPAWPLGESRGAAAARRTASPFFHFFTSFVFFLVCSWGCVLTGWSLKVTGLHLPARLAACAACMQVPLACSSTAAGCLWTALAWLCA